MDVDTSLPNDEQLVESVDLTNNIEMLKFAGDNGKRWALLFCRVAKLNGYDLDPSWMQVWFCNAIEEADRIRSRLRKQKE